MQVNTFESLAVLLLICNTVLVAWTLFRKQLQESVGELFLTVVLLGALAATIVPIVIGAELKAQQASSEATTDEVAVATNK